MNKKLMDLLYRSFDSELTAAERRQLDEGLADSVELRAEKDRLQRMRGAVKASAAEGFGPFFAERVMAQIKAQPEAENGLQEMFEALMLSFRKVAIVGAVAVIALVAFNLSSSDDKTLAAVFGVTDNAGIEELLETPFESVLE